VGDRHAPECGQGRLSLGPYPEAGELRGEQVFEQVDGGEIGQERYRRTGQSPDGLLQIRGGPNLGGGVVEE
jgi:hypothetical protein